MRTSTPFEWDIFISYAHVDNKRPDPDQEGWISYFHKCLNLQLAKLCGAKPRIWRDNKLRGDDYFPDEIVDQFRNVAFLVSILSPSYVESEWCLRELETFRNTARQTDDPRLKNFTERTDTRRRATADVHMVREVGDIAEKFVIVIYG